MDNVIISVSNPKVLALGNKFTGVKTVSLQDDVLTIEKGNGVKFVSNIHQMKGTYQDGWFKSTKRKYLLYNAQGECLLINFSDWDGWIFGVGDRRMEIFNIIESSPLVQPTKAQTIRKIISYIILGFSIFQDIVGFIFLFLAHAEIISFWIGLFLCIFAFITSAILWAIYGFVKPFKRVE